VICAIAFILSAVLGAVALAIATLGFVIAMDKSVGKKVELAQWAVLAGVVGFFIYLALLLFDFACCN
jgi:hypothetical protein